MFSITELIAQKKTAPVEWSIAGQLPPMPDAPVSLGVAGPVAGVHNNKMIVAGGANFPDSLPWQGGKKKYHNSIYVFTKKDNKLTSVTGNFSLLENIAYAANCCTPKGVFFAGGENEKGLSSKAALLQWDNTRKLVLVDSLPALPAATTNASATCFNNIVFVAGGEVSDGVSGKCWAIDLNNATAGWKELAPLPKPVSHAVFAAVGTKNVLNLYLIGGRRKSANGNSELYNSVFEYNVTQNQWKELMSLPYPLSAGTGVATGSGSIILFGGDRGATFTKVENYIAKINAASNPSEKEQLIQEKNQLLSSHPGFSKDVLLYNPVSGKCKTIGNIPYPTPVTTTAFLWDNLVMIPSGEIKAGVRTPQIITAKIRSGLK